MNGLFSRARRRRIALESSRDYASRSWLPLTVTTKRKGASIYWSPCRMCFSFLVALTFANLSKRDRKPRAMVSTFSYNARHLLVLSTGKHSAGCIESTYQALSSLLSLEEALSWYSPSTLCKGETGYANPSKVLLPPFSFHYPLLLQRRGERVYSLVVSLFHRREAKLYLIFYRTLRAYLLSR